MKYFTYFLFASVCGLMAYIVTQDRPCHTFQPTDSSHIRMNTCTGEAHVIVRGPNGFEWQLVR